MGQQQFEPKKAQRTKRSYSTPTARMSTPANAQYLDHSLTPELGLGVKPGARLTRVVSLCVGIIPRMAPAAFIDRQLPFEYTITSRSTNVVVPLPVVSAADSAANMLVKWNALYDAYNEVACLMLDNMTPELHRQFENYSPYEMLQELKSMFEKQAGVKRFDLI
uniref:Zinc finger, CCHC-type n=1 Tax=Tanacetum cinerariifolium TaxID=118510 RepID=A0A6L2MJF4_TANCI|nr:hypothetical protein [Tanacetum cinerariifolium]